jgi:uncharacterized protein (TIGR00290 family)
MTTKEKVLFTWSGGKDSALALYELQQSQEYKVVALLTTVTEGYDRISMHGVRRTLLQHQALSLGLPLEEVIISQQASNEEYESQMQQVLARYVIAGVQCVAFGDIYLQDLKAYREQNLARIGMKAVFPLWKRDTRELMRTFIDLGFKAVTVCVDTEALDGRFAGRELDDQFLRELPATVDPCGENGEYHSFVYDGPNFRRRVAWVKGEIVLRENRFCYCDLVQHQLQLNLGPVVMQPF